MHDFLQSLRKRVLLYDGSKGVMLQGRGLRGDEAAESWNLLKPEEVKDVYRQYKEAGSDVLQTNTFPGNSVTLGNHGLGDKVADINAAGVKLAREVAGRDVFVAASVGPTGLFLEPAGELSFELAYGIFREQVKALAEAGADLINFETFSDLNELRAAILAAKENTELPVIASLTFHKGSKTLSGNPAEVCAIVCQALGADVVGANCSGGPESLLEPIKKMSAVASVPLAVKPNAGLPEIKNGKAVYNQTPEMFSSYAQDFIACGVRLIGGCCGTTPEHIRALKKELAGIEAPEAAIRNIPAIASAYSYFVCGADDRCKQLPLWLKKPADALTAGDFDEIITAALEREAEGADYLLLDFGDLCDFRVSEFASSFGFSVKVPVVVKTGSPDVLAKFLRYYPGRAGVVPTGQTAGSRAICMHYGALFLPER
ncbi:MAG: homocysteine methyltransferase [Firmicutes bacterium]|nr:homocysteine methyltransferase [Bacillota bacterium]